MNGRTSVRAGKDVCVEVVVTEGRLLCLAKKVRELKEPLSREIASASRRKDAGARCGRFPTEEKKGDDDCWSLVRIWAALDDAGPFGGG
jgi:hypothetical protein